MTWRKGYIPGWHRETTTWAWNILLSQKVGGMVKESKEWQSLFDGLPLVKLGEFQHQNK